MLKIYVNSVNVKDIDVNSVNVKDIKDIDVNSINFKDRC